MDLINYMQFLGPMQDQFTKIFSTMSGVIGVILVLWALNFIVGLIQRTYATGKAFGSFYRNYLHRFFKGAFSNLFSILRPSNSSYELNK